MGLEQTTQNYPRIYIFGGHIDRVVKQLDRLYEFGPTQVFTYVSDIESGRAMLKMALDNLTMEEINRGLERVEHLTNRKRVCPWPTEFAQICTANDEDWHDIKGYYEQRSA